MTPKTKFGSMAWMIALAGVLGLGSAHANTGTLTLTSTFGAIGGSGAGPLANATWQPIGGAVEALQFVYCVDLSDDVNVGTSYSSTTATTTGSVNMTNPVDVSGAGSALSPINGVLQNNAGQDVAGDVAWLLDNYGIGFPNLVNTTQAEGLQLAIWQEIYGSTYVTTKTGDLTMGNTAEQAIATQAAIDINALNAAPNAASTSTANFLWFTPLPLSSSGLPNQALVGFVPEPTTTVLLGAFLAVALLGLAAKRKLA